jgi:hypothetical protein
MGRLDIKRLGFELAGWVLLGAVLAEWWSRVTAGGAQGYINADIVHIPAVVEDVLIRGNPMAHAWHLTPAPYFFPDGALYLAVRLLVGRLELAQLVASGLQPVLLSLAARAVLVRLADRPAIGALGPAVVALVLAFGLLGHDPYALVTVPAYHTGVAMVATASAAALWSYARTGRRWPLAMLAAFAFAGTLSDALLLVGPAAATAVVLAFTWRRRADEVARRAWTAGAVLVAASLGGFLTLRALPFPRAPQLSLQVLELPRTLRQAWVDWQAWDSWSESWLLAGLVGLMLVAWRSSSWPARVTSATWALSVLSTLGSILLSANLNDAGWPRYLLWPAFSGLLGLVLLGATTDRRVGLGLAGCAIFVARTVNPTGWSLHSPPDFALRRDVACVDALADREDAHVVVGQYWMAKPVTLLSTRGVRVAQFEPDLRDISLWVTSRAWFFPATQAGLVLTNGLEAGPLDALGADFEPVTCGTLQLRVYRGASRERLRSLLGRHAFDAIGGPP